MAGIIRAPSNFLNASRAAFQAPFAEQMLNLLRLATPLRYRLLIRSPVRLLDSSFAQDVQFTTAATNWRRFPFRVPQALLSTSAVDAGTAGTLDRKTKKNYRYKISVLSKRGTVEAASAAEKILRLLTEESRRTNQCQVNVALHNAVLNAWANSASPDAYVYAINLLEEMMSWHEQHPGCCPAPDVISYNIALKACAQSARHSPQAVVMADTLIRTIEEASTRGLNGCVHPDTQSYNLVILAHAKKAEYGAPNGAEDWLHHLSKVNAQGGPAGPDSISFNTVLKAWNECPEERGADRSLEILQLMMKLHRDGLEEVSPTSDSFCTVIDAFARRHRPSEAEKVLRMALEFFLLDEQQGYNLYSHSKQKQHRPNLTPCFNASINGWAKSEEQSAAARAEALLQEMLRLSREKHTVTIWPNVWTYTSCMEAVAKSGTPDAPNIVEGMFHEMLGHNDLLPRDEAYRPPLPNHVALDCAVRAWNDSSDPSRAQHMERLLSAMGELALSRNLDADFLPRASTVNVCLRALCSNGGLLTSAAAMLGRMETLGSTNTDSYVTLIYEALKVSSNDGAQYEAVFIAASILERLHFQMTQRVQMQWPKNPEAIYYKVLLALSKIGNAAAADCTFSILHGMETSRESKVRPSARAYAASLFAVSRIPREERQTMSKPALDILNRMIRMHDDPNSQLELQTADINAMFTVLASMRASWAADRAVSLLDQLATIAKRSKTNKIRLDYKCYDRCLQAIAWGQDKDMKSAARAVATLERMVRDVREGRAHDPPSETGFHAIYEYFTLVGDPASAQLAIVVQRLEEEVRNEYGQSGHNSNVLSAFNGDSKALETVADGHQGRSDIHGNLLKHVTTSACSNDKLLNALEERLNFFFSDANIRHDRFMQKYMRHIDNGDSANGGTVPIDGLLKFNSIKCLTSDPEVIKETVRTKLSDKLFLSSDKKSVGRVEKFNDEHLNKDIELSLFVRNLPINKTEDGATYGVTTSELRAIFEKYGEVARIKLLFKKSKNSNASEFQATFDSETGRRDPLGACYIEFASKESLEKAEHAVNVLKGEKVDAKEKLMVLGKSLQVMLLQDYIDGKIERWKKRTARLGKKGGDKFAIKSGI